MKWVYFLLLQYELIFYLVSFHLDNRFSTTRYAKYWILSYNTLGIFCWNSSHPYINDNVHKIVGISWLFLCKLILIRLFYGIEISAFGRTFQRSELGPKILLYFLYFVTWGSILQMWNHHVCVNWAYPEILPEIFNYSWLF